MNFIVHLSILLHLNFEFPQFFLPYGFLPDSFSSFHVTKELYMVDISLRKTIFHHDDKEHRYNEVHLKLRIFVGAIAEIFHFYA